MLEKFYCLERDLSYLRNCPIASSIENLAGWLWHNRYSAVTAKRYLSIARHFSWWMESEKLVASDITYAHVRRFIRDYSPSGSRKGKRFRSIEPLLATGRHLIRIFREQGFSPSASVSSIDLSISEFSEHLLHQRGLSPRTIRSYAFYLQRFLCDCFGAALIEMEGISTIYLHSYIKKVVAVSSITVGKLTSASLRQFLKFRLLKGERVEHLLDAFPVLPAWRTAAPLRTFSDSQLRGLFRAFDRKSAIGKRNYAMTRCMADLGMRAMDVSILTLDDINWRKGAIRISNNKPRRPYELPLLHKTGKALADYIHHGRPNTDQPFVFLRYLPPHTNLSRTGVQDVVRTAYQKAELPPEIQGTHILRRTMATSLHRQGTGSKEIADILGHQSILSLQSYVRTDHDLLNGVITPWPEVML